MKISPARKSAFEILNKIEKERAFSSVLLPIYEENLSPKDRSLCHEIVLGVLRTKLYLDEIIKKLTKKSLKKFDLEVLNALRIGLYQIFYLDRVPAYSAVNESVSLVKLAKKKSAGGLVNAVLRRALKEEFELKFSDDLKKISIETSHPVWLIERWKEQFGLESAKKIAEANNQTPKMTFRLTAEFYRNDTDKQVGILKSIEDKVAKSEVTEDSFVVKELTGELRELAADGLIYFQDEGSQIVASSVNLQENESFFDVCASPGSKTTFLQMDIAKRKIQHKIFVAGDFYRHRIRNLKTNCENQGVENIEIVQYDASENLPFGDESFDVVLVDAPCSGTGTIRNNPEIRYNLNEADFSELSFKQLAILHHASKPVKHGGRLVYSTCSLETEENEKVIRKFLQENSGFEKIRVNLGESFLTAEGFARIFPHREDTDGFFIAVLKRIL